MNSCFVRPVVKRGTVVAVLALSFAGQTTVAQLVTPKTVPLHQDGQFAIFPSARDGMGGVSIAVDDTLGDAFANPAKAGRLRQGAIFASPYFHSVSAGRGGGHTLPVGGFAVAGDWTAGGIFAIQELEQGFSQAISERSAANQYAMAAVARRLPAGLSLGASAYVAGLEAIDGIDLLYRGSDHIDQSGTLADLRLGAVKEWGSGRRIDVVLLHNRTSLTQDVHYTTSVWDQTTRTTTVTQRLDHNDDRTTIWGLHTQFSRPIGTDGWRMGLIATSNRLSHPKIPNYQFVNIPRDPGTTYGFNLGVGIARLLAGSTVGIDFVEEPMFSTTWGTAARDTAIVGGGVLHAGERTVDNKLRFSNVKMSLGLAKEFGYSHDSSSALNLQLGLGVYAINYRLRQANHIQRTNRVQDEGWTEWTPTFGFGYRGKDLAIQYSFRLTCGPSDCIGMGDKVTVVQPDVSPGGIIAAPSSPLTIDGGTAHVHQFIVKVPVR